jgi:DNA-directed RNA polymerase subunit RPC12/RpoP
MVFSKPPHPPVPEGHFECPECAWALMEGPGWQHVLAEVEEGGYSLTGYPLEYEEVYVPCEYCGGKAYVAERRHRPDRRQRGERRR